MKVNRTLIKIGILCVALNGSGTGATTPALGSIAAGMPLVAPALIQLIATFPTLFQAISSLIYGKSIEFMKKKTWLYIGSVTFIVGGVAPAFFHTNIWVILFFRAVLGFGCGILIPMATDLCIDFFEDKERHSMIGYVSAFISLSGVIFQMLGGYLASIRWDYSFYAYLISVIFLLIAFFTLPEPDRSAKLEADAAAHVNTKLTVGTYVHALVFLFFFMFWFVASTNGSMVLLEERIATPVQIGTAFSLMTFGSFICSLIFGQVFKALRFALLPISYVFGAIGLYLCYTGQTLTIFILGLIFLGCGLGFVYPVTMSKLSYLVPYSATSKAISLAACGLAVGGFFQPLIFNLFTVPGRTPFIIGAIGMAVLAVLVVIADRTFPTHVSASVSQPEKIQG